MFFKQKKPYRLLTPGPVPLYPTVMNVMSQPMIHHRTPEFEKCLQRVNQKLKLAFATSEHVFVHTATGTGAMESSIVNTLSPGQEVLCVVSGKFGERWAQMCRVYDLKVHELQIPWGEAVQPIQIENFLERHPQIRAVFCQACETSTATRHPIREIANIIRNRPHTIFIVDAITAIGAMELEMDAWGLDVVIGGSQKAFMLPTGLSFIALSKKAWAFLEASRLPKFYWDLKLEYKSQLKGETHFSSAVPLYRALDITLDYLVGDEKIKTLKRIATLAEATRESLIHLGFKVYSSAPSPSVTAMATPEYIDSQKLRDHLELKHNITVIGGQEHLKGKILRIGHLGYITNDDMFALVDGLYTSLVELCDKNVTARSKKMAISVMKKHLC